MDVLLRGVSISYNLSDKKKGKKNIKTLKKINVFRGGENYLLKYEQSKMENKREHIELLNGGQVNDAEVQMGF